MEIVISITKDFCLEMGGSLKGWEESHEEEGEKRWVTPQSKDLGVVGDRHVSEEEVRDGDKCLRDAQ